MPVAAFAIPLFVVAVIIQLVAGWIGVEHYLGFWGALAAVVVAIFFQFTLPLTVGTFLGATAVWEWHWLPAILLAAPGLALAVPGTIASVLASVRGAR